MTEKKIQFNVDSGHDGNRLDRYLAEMLPDNSRTYYQRLIKAGAVSCDGKICNISRCEVKAGAAITVICPDEKKFVPVAENIPLPILYEDDFLLLINKPAGLIVHPGAGNPTGTIVNALLGRDPDFMSKFPEAEEGRPGIVHRLDKDTSGCLLIAKTAQAHFKLAQSFAEREVHKIYAALVCGRPKKKCEEMVTLIGRHKINRQKMAVVDRHGKEAVTIYELLQGGKVDGFPASFLKVEIKTGRTHQIRVHLAWKGLPIIGDDIYGSSRSGKPAAARQMLHAWKISFPHPATGEILEFEAPLPDDFLNIIARLKTDA